MIYGFRLRLQLTILTLVAVTLATGGIIGVQVLKGQQDADCLTEVPLIALMFLGMVWHGQQRLVTVRERLTAMEEVQRVSEANLRLLEQQRWFLQGASHELGTPITVVLGHVELIERAVTGHGLRRTPGWLPAGDAVALDLAGAAGDRGHDRLPVAEAHDALGGEAVPRADLHAQQGGGDVGLRALELGHRAFPAARLALGEEPRGPVGQQPRRVGLHLQVSHDMGQRLEGADRPAERVPCLGEREHLIQGRLGVPRYPPVMITFSCSMLASITDHPCFRSGLSAERQRGAVFMEPSHSSHNVPA